MVKHAALRQSGKICVYINPFRCRCRALSGAVYHRIENVERFADFPAPEDEVFPEVALGPGKGILDHGQLFRGEAGGVSVFESGEKRGETALVVVAVRI